MIKKNVISKDKLFSYMLDSKVKILASMTNPSLSIKKRKLLEKKLFILDNAMTSFLEKGSFENMTIKISSVVNELVILIDNEILLLDYLEFLYLFTGGRKEKDVSLIVLTLTELGVEFIQQLYICCIESTIYNNYKGVEHFASKSSYSIFSKQTLDRVCSIRKTLSA